MTRPTFRRPRTGFRTAVELDRRRDIEARFGVPSRTGVTEQR